MFVVGKCSIQRTVFPLDREKDKTLAKLIEVTGRQVLDNHHKRTTVFTLELSCGGQSYTPIEWLSAGVNAMYMYCLFCNTNNRSHIAEIIHNLMDIKVITPKILRRKWIHGKIVDAIQDYLPGYCFIYTDKPINEFAIMLQLKDVYRILGNRDDGYQLRGSDRAFAETMWSCGGLIGALKAYKDGDKLRLAENSFGHKNGEIIKVDRRGRALVRFSFDSIILQSWVTIEQIRDRKDSYL